MLRKGLGSLPPFLSFIHSFFLSLSLYNLLSFFHSFIHSLSLQFSLSFFLSLFLSLFLSFILSLPLYILLSLSLSPSLLSFSLSTFFSPSHPSMEHQKIPAGYHRAHSPPGPQAICHNRLTCPLAHPQAFPCYRVSYMRPDKEEGKEIRAICQVSLHTCMHAHRQECTFISRTS